MLTIGTLAKKTGTKVQTIRYYEQIGLMPEPGRTEGANDAMATPNSTACHLSGTPGNWDSRWTRSVSSSI